MQERMHELGLRADLSDDNLGLPNHTTWVAEDQECADDAVWTALVERGDAVVLVGAKIERIIIPRHRTMLDRIRDTVPVTISIRVDGEPTEAAFSKTLGRKPVTEMRSQAPATAAA